MVNGFNSFHLCNNILNYKQQETYTKELLYEFPILTRKYKVLQRINLKNRKKGEHKIRVSFANYFTAQLVAYFYKNNIIFKRVTVKNLSSTVTIYAQ